MCFSTAIIGLKNGKCHFPYYYVYSSVTLIGLKCDEYYLPYLIMYFITVVMGLKIWEVIFATEVERNVYVMFKRLRAAPSVTR